MRLSFGDEAQAFLLSAQLPKRKTSGSCTGDFGKSRAGCTVGVQPACLFTRAELISTSGFCRSPLIKAVLNPPYYHIHALIIGTGARRDLRASAPFHLFMGLIVSLFTPSDAAVHCVIAWMCKSQSIKKRVDRLTAIEADYLPKPSQSFSKASFAEKLDGIAMVFFLFIGAIIAGITFFKWDDLCLLAPYWHGSGRNSDEGIALGCLRPEQPVMAHRTSRFAAASRHNRNVHRLWQWPVTVNAILDRKTCPRCTLPTREAHTRRGSRLPRRRGLGSMLPIYPFWQVFMPTMV